MSPIVRVAACAVAVATGFSGGAVMGRAVGRLESPRQRLTEVATAGTDLDDHTGGAGATSAEDGGHHSLEVPAPGGLLVSQAGYMLQPVSTLLSGQTGEVFGFRIAGPDGAAVLGFEPRHERLLHLVVVARDLTTFHHLHPSLDADGAWTVPLPALAPGAYHAFASFAVAGGPELTLSSGLLVSGDAVFSALPETGPSVVVDGYTVTLSGAPMAAAATTVELRVDADGVPVVDLQPYLGALGHLVALRTGDLAYSHVHPVGAGDDSNGPTVRFMLDVPSPGAYRLFFDFAHRGTVHTAAFTIHVPGPAPAGAGPADTAVTTGPVTEPPQPEIPVEPIDPVATTATTATAPSHSHDTTDPTDSPESTEPTETEPISPPHLPDPTDPPVP